MPLPDATEYSTRVYELLKETDLQNLSYAQFQGVAEKLFIEPENEDELRRLVLIQLARMAVAGDWDGFLTGGGGGSSGTIGYIGDVMKSGDDIFQCDQGVQYGSGTGTGFEIGTNRVVTYPFVAPASGTIDEFSVNVLVAATNTMRVNIYANASGNYPGAKLTSSTADFDCSSTGTKTATPSGTISLVAGTTYWVCFVWLYDYQGAGALPTMSCVQGGNGIGWNEGPGEKPRTTLVDTAGGDNALPSAMSSSGYDAGLNKKCCIGFTYA